MKLDYPSITLPQHKYRSLKVLKLYITQILEGENIIVGLQSSSK
jgi:hypothetical protein